MKKTIVIIILIGLLNNLQAASIGELVVEMLNFSIKRIVLSSSDTNITVEGNNTNGN